MTAPRGDPPSPAATVRDHGAVDLGAIAERLATAPGVVAVTLGGSRARGEHHPDSDWDLGVYHRGPLSDGLRDLVQSLDPHGTVTGSGEWGVVMDGGAWLRIEGERVDVLWRDVDAVTRWSQLAGEGHFEIHGLPGYLAGIPTTVLPGEVAHGRLLAGDATDLPRIDGFPPALREHAPEVWRFRRTFSLDRAAEHAARHDVTTCIGALARAALEEAHARAAEQGRWVLNEKGLLVRNGLSSMDRLLANVSADPSGLAVAVAEARSLLNPDGHEPGPGDQPLLPH